MTGAVNNGSIRRYRLRKKEAEMDKKLRVLLLNGSPKTNGNTMVAVNEMVRVFEDEGVEAEVVHVGNRDIRGCVSCNSCSKSGKSEKVRINGSKIAENVFLMTS